MDFTPRTIALIYYQRRFSGSALIIKLFYWGGLWQCVSLRLPKDRGCAFGTEIILEHHVVFKLEVLLGVGKYRERLRCKGLKDVAP